MRNKNLLIQVTSIERLDDNAAVFDKLQTNINYGRGDEVAREMSGFPKSDLDPYKYINILDWAVISGERIVFDNGQYVITNKENSIILLYEYPEEEEEVPEVTDKFGNKLSVGDKVIWVDPDPVGRDLNRVYEVNDIHSEDTIWINDEFSEAEVPPQELILAKVLAEVWAE